MGHDILALQSLLLDAAECITVSDWEITISFKSETELEAYKGNILHGGFGRALAHTDNSLYLQWFAQQTKDNRKVCPFILFCEDSLTTTYQPNQTFSFGLTLYTATQHALSVVRNALLTWQSFGMGPKRNQFKILKIVNSQGVVLYQQDMGKFVIPEQINLSKLLKQRLGRLEFEQWPQPIANYALTTLSRCRLQHHGCPVTQVPDYVVWQKAIQRRFIQLLPQEHSDDFKQALRNTDIKKPLIVVRNSTVVFADWQKFSVKDNRMVNMGGLLGYWEYAGITQTCYLWLLLGELIGIGNKTSFGFGCYQGELSFYETTN